MRKTERKTTKLVAILLALIMCIGLMPTMAFAAAATYTKATTVEDGAQYLLVAQGSSNYYALKASSGSIGKQQVTISDDAISLDDADCVWTATVSEGKATFKNGSNYIKRSSSTLSLGSSSAAEWSYDGSALTTKGSSNTYYMVYSSGFKASTSSGSNVVLYKLGTSGGGGDDADVEVTPTTENPTSDYSIEVGEDFTIEVTNSSTNKAYDFTITFGTAGVAEADETSVNIAKSGTGVFKVTGLKDGTTTITISNNNSSSERKATINLTVGEGGSENPPSGDETVIEITPTTDNPVENVTVAVGEKFTVKVTNAGSSEYTFELTTDKSGVASLSESSLTIASEAEDEFEVTGAAAGTVVITISNGTKSYSRKATINVTVTGEGGGENPPAGDETVIELTPTTDNPTESISISVGGSFTVALTNGGSSEYTYTASFSQSGIVNLSETSVTLAKGASTDIVVTGAANGTTTITIQNSNSYGSSYVRKGTINVTVTGEGGGTSGDTTVDLEAVKEGTSAKTATIAVGDVLTVNLTHSSQADKAFTNTVDNSEVADFVSGETLTVEKGGQGTVKIEGISKGTAVFTFSGVNTGSSTSGSTYSATLTVTVTDGGENPPSGDATYIGFTSDMHGQTSVLENWFKNLPVTLTNMCFCGDFSYSSGSTYLNHYKTAVSLTEQYVGTHAGVYTSGNHELMNYGSLTDFENYTTDFRRLGAATNVTTNSYAVYCIGAYKSDGTGGFQDSDITALDNYLDSVSAKKPVFILSHYPLHYISSRTITNAKALIDVLNEHPNAVFMWGHNHSQSGESHYGEVLSAGDSIKYTSSTSAKINFTYACAGAMNDSQGSYDGCVAKVSGTKITFYYYDSTGSAAQIKGRSATSYTVDISNGDTETYYTITASAGANGSISPAGKKEVKEGESQSFTITAADGYEIDTVTVDGKTVTVSGNAYEFTNVKSDHTISASFKLIPVPDPEVDNKTNTVASYSFVEGKLSVDCEKACVVLAKVGDEYTVLTAVKVDDDTYTFDYSGVSGEFTLVIALKGDADLDGDVDMKDATAVMMSWVNETPLEGAANYVVNVDGKDGIAMSDATAIMMAWVNETNFAWN